MEEQAQADHQKDSGEEPEYYDYVIIGTGLVETVTSYILSLRHPVRILHIDPSSVYGSEFSTLNYAQLLRYFNAQNENDEFVSTSRQFNIDLTPKLLLQDSSMKDFLVENNIQDLVTFTSIKGSYLYTDRLHSIPTKETQALRSSVIGLMQKPRVIKFFWNVKSVVEGKSKPKAATMLEEFKWFGLNQESIDFIGHAIALHLDDSYLLESPDKTYPRIARYISSIVSYENSESPYLYPLYGLSELCQAFARKSAVNGTTFMLNASADISLLKESGILIVTDPDGVTHNVRARKILSDPKYFPGSKVEKEVIRGILIVKKESDSRNVIFLKNQLKRNHDVFCAVLGSEVNACPPDLQVVVLSTIRETQMDPKDEITAVLNKFSIHRQFFETRKIYTNTDFDNVYFSRNVDESALLDNMYDDICDVCSKILGQDTPFQLHKSRTV